MGNSLAAPPGTKKRSAEERNRMRQQTIQANINHFQAAVQQPQSTNITRSRLDDYHLLYTANAQLHRGDRPLNKTDLVAILLRLDASTHPHNAHDLYSQLGTKDLIALIRGIIYRPATPTAPAAVDILPRKITPTTPRITAAHEAIRMNLLT